MAGELDIPSRVPKVALEITTYELSNENGLPMWIATLSHIFYGDTEAEAKRILEAHTKTDVFFAGSLKGKWNRITLSNSQPQIFQTRQTSGGG